MKSKQLIFLLTIVVLSLSLSACGGSTSIASSWPGLTVVEDTVYVTFNQAVYAIQADNGTQIGFVPDEPINTTTFYAPAAPLGDSRFLAGSFKKYLYLFDFNTGSSSEFFKGAGGRWVASPLVTEEVIYAPNSDYSLYALDLNGNLLWTFETGDPLWATPLLDGETLYVASMDHLLYALDAASGAKLWATNLGGSTVATPALDENGILYIGTFEEEVLAIDSENGDVLWRFETGNWVWASPLVYDGIVFIADLDGSLYALDTETQKVLWRVEGEGAITGAPLLYEDTLYFCTQAGFLYAVDLDGSILWSRNQEDVEWNGSPVLAGDLILVGSLGKGALVYAYSTNGTLQWQYTPE